MKQTEQSELITDNQSLDGAHYHRAEFTIPTYDDGFGPLWISRNSIGINGIVRARTWEDAYSICEDEFFPEADEAIEEIIKEYGFKREHVQIVRGADGIERPAVSADYAPTLIPEFVGWKTIETPDLEAWMENKLFQEAFGFRPNGPRQGDVNNHGIYSKDLNGDLLDRLTAEMVDDLGIVLEISEPTE